MQLVSFLGQFLLPAALLLFLAWRFLITPAVRNAQDQIRNEEERTRLRQKLEAAYAKEDLADEDTEADLDAAIDELKRSTKEGS